MSILRARRGFSIIELSVASFLLSLLLTMIYLVMQPGMRQFAQGNVFGGVQQETQKGMQALVKDLSYAHKDQVGFGGGPNPYIWFLSGEAPTNAPATFALSNSGQLVFQKWICYYYDPTQKVLVKAEIALTPATEVPVPPPAPAPNLGAFIAVTGPMRKVVTRGVEQFVITKMTMLNYNIRLSAAGVFGSDKTQLTLESEVSVRNQ